VLIGIPSSESKIKAKSGSDKSAKSKELKNDAIGILSKISGDSDVGFSGFRFTSSTVADKLYNFSNDDNHNPDDSDDTDEDNDEDHDDDEDDDDDDPVDKEEMVSARDDNDNDSFCTVCFSSSSSVSARDSCCDAENVIAPTSTSFVVPSTSMRPWTSAEFVISSFVISTSPPPLVAAAVEVAVARPPPAEAAADVEADGMTEVVFVVRIVGNTLVVDVVGMVTVFVTAVFVVDAPGKTYGAAPPPTKPYSSSKTSSPLSSDAAAAADDDGAAAEDDNDVEDLTTAADDDEEDDDEDA